MHDVETGMIIYSDEPHFLISPGNCVVIFTFPCKIIQNALTHHHNVSIYTSL